MIAVTGAAGFIGSHLVDALANSDEAIRVIEKPGAAIGHLPLDRVDVVFADVRDRSAVRAAVAGCSQVYHLAANPNLWCRDRREFDAVNRQGTVHVIEESLAAGADRILHVSTESILTARADPSQPIETCELDERLLHGRYTLSKLQAERFAFEAARSGANVVVANPTLPVGPGDRGLSPPTRMSLLFCRGKMPALLECRFNMIDVRDVAFGLVRIMKAGRCHRRYILGAHNVLLSDWLDLLGRCAGCAAPRFRIPYSMALAYAWFCEWRSDWITGVMPEATVTGVRLTRKSMHFDAAECLAELGLSPRPLNVSAKDVVEWFRKTGMLKSGFDSGPVTS